MNWHSLDEFLHMGGYGLYVWGSYLVTALCIAAELVMLRLRGKSTNVDSVTENNA